MIPKKRRLNSKAFLALLGRTRTLNTPGFSFRYGWERSKDARFAVVVSKNVSLKATVRNKIRRRVYEAVHKVLKVNGIKDFHSGIFIAKKGADAIKFKEVAEEIGKLLDRAEH